MEISITENTIKEIEHFIEEGKLVTYMNNAGLSFAAMAFILTELQNACDRVLIEMMGKDEV